MPTETAVIACLGALLTVLAFSWWEWRRIRESNS